MFVIIYCVCNVWILYVCVFPALWICGDVLMDSPSTSKVIGCHWFITWVKVSWFILAAGQASTARNIPPGMVHWVSRWRHSAPCAKQGFYQVATTSSSSLGLRSLTLQRLLRYLNGSTTFSYIFGSCHDRICVATLCQSFSAAIRATTEPESVKMKRDKMISQPTVSLGLCIASNSGLSWAQLSKITEHSSCWPIAALHF